MEPKKIAVIGAGNVGAEIASQITGKELADVVLVDKYEDIAKGKALDILTSASLKGSSSRITGGSSFDAIKNSDIVIVTAGLPRKPGMSREELVQSNGKIISDIAGQVKTHAPNAVIIMVTNPLDVMTWFAWKVSGFAPEKVIGMAGVLDTARFKTFVAEELGVTPDNINAMVLGGHGDEMVPLVDFASVSGIPLTQLISAVTLGKIVERTRKGGAEVVNLLKTGSAYYAPAISAVKMAEAILKDRKSAMPVSALLRGEYGIEEVYLGVPAILGAGGIEKVIELELGTEDLEALRASAGVVRKTISEAEKLIVFN